MSKTIEQNIVVNGKDNASQQLWTVEKAIAAIDKALKDIDKAKMPSMDKLGNSTHDLEQANFVANNLAGTFERLSHQSAFSDGTADGLKKLGDSAGDANKNTEDYSQVLQVLAKKLGISNSEAAKFAKALGATGAEAAVAGVAIGAIVGVIKVYVDRLHEAEAALTKFGDGILDAGVSGIEWFVDSLGELSDKLEEVMEQMYEFAEAGAEIQRTYYNVYTILGSEAGNEIVGFTEKLEELYGLDADDLVGDMQSIVAAAGSLGVSTGDMVKATENMTLMAEDLSIIAGDFEKASNDIGNAISKGFVSRSSSLYVLLTKEEKDALRELGSEVERYNFLMSRSERIKQRYVEFLNTEAGRLMQLKNAYSTLMNNISKLALGLYAKIAPLLTILLQLANKALTAIAKLFNLDIKGSANTGSSSIADGIKDSIGKVGDEAKDSKKKVDELKRSVASFDDVIQIQDTKTDEDDGELLGDIGELSDIDIGDIWDLDDAVNTLGSDWDKFKKLLEDGNYFLAGIELARMLREALQKIPWDEIRDKAKSAGKAIAEFLNGFFADKALWNEVGKFFGNALNTVVDFLGSFATNFDFKNFGESVGIAWKSFLDSFSEVDAAKALYEWFMGVFEAVGAFFKTNPLSNLANSLSLILENFFNNITDEDKETMADTVKNILNDVFTSALILAESIFENSDKVIEIINTLLDSAINWLANGGDDKIKALGTAIVGIINKLRESGIVEKLEGIIKQIIDDIDLGSILSAATGLALDIWAATMKVKLKVLWEEIKALFTNIGPDIAEGLKTMGQLVIALLAALFFNIIAILGNAIEGWDNMMQNFWSGIAEKLDAFQAKMVAGIKEFIDDVITGFKIMGQGIVNIFNNIINTVKNWINNVRNLLTNAFKGLNPFSGLNVKLPSFNVSSLWSGKHATGGITNGPSIGMIGEAGREAVLPLDRNTGWMDELAGKINSKSSGGGSTQLVIDASSFTKDVYTRSELLAGFNYISECLKAGRATVSMEY